MDTTTILTEFRKNLRHGAVKAISDKTGIGYYTVLRVLNGDTRSPKTPEIIQAAIEHYTEAERSLKNAIKTMEEIVSSIDETLSSPIAQKVISGSPYLEKLNQ